MNITLEEAIDRYEIYYKPAFDALAKLEEPDFLGRYERDGRDMLTLFRAFLFLYEAYRSNPQEVLDYFNRELSIRSNGAVTVRKADYNPMVKGPAVPLELVGSSVVKKLVFGPYDTPFIFMER